MSIAGRMRENWPKDWPLRLIPRESWTSQRPTYREAQPSIINTALDRSLGKPTGNWFVFAASRDVRVGHPFGTQVAGIELVAWRDENRRLRVGPRSCPHLGADLATGAVRDGVLFCRWHGLALDGNPGPAACTFGWKPLPSFDDGLLAWVRLDSVGGEEPRDTPVLPQRPSGDTLQAVAHLVGVCEPCDVIANRLDPWHGAWFHPYTFTRLDVLSTPTEEDDRFVVSVTFRIGRFGVPVIAEFTTPSARCIVMRILEGEGAGSIVETHATPTGVDSHGRQTTAIIEATTAYSPRPGFKTARYGRPLVTAMMRYAANRLWRDDLIYAERRYHLRSGN